MQSSPWALQIASQQPTPRHRLTWVPSWEKWSSIPNCCNCWFIVCNCFINGLYQWVISMGWPSWPSCLGWTQDIPSWNQKKHNPATTIFKRAASFRTMPWFYWWNIFSWNAQVFVKRADYTKIAIWWDLMTILPSNRWRLATSTSCHSLQVKALVCAPGLASTNLQVWTLFFQWSKAKEAQDGAPVR